MKTLISAPPPDSIMEKTPAGLGIIASEIIKTSEDCGKRHRVDLRPAPLFRTLGLRGLSASLPPHRRLRSVLNTTPSTSGQSVDRSDPLMDRPHRNSPLHGLKRIQDKPLPKIVPANHQKDEISIKNEPQTVRVQYWHHSSRDTGIRTEKEEYLFEEVWREQTPKVMRKKKNKQVKNEASDLSLWIQSLEITDNKRLRNNSSGRGNWAGPLCKGAGQTQRDRRPHFLPPITQSDCLLNVPLLLPDNSPPPSPCSPSDIRFFPLSVPHIQPFPRERRGDAAAQRH